MVPISSGDFSLALVNAALLALWPVLPGLLLGYVRQLLAVRHTWPEFSLRKSETLELNRAVRLHEVACARLKAIKDASTAPPSFWRGILQLRSEAEYSEEFEDLKAHAHHLRQTIARLQRQPLRRLRSWMHLMCSKSALGRALAAHVVGFALLLVMFHVSQQPALAGEIAAGAHAMVTWYPIDERFFYANAAAAGFAAAAAPLFYLVRRIGLRHEYEFEFDAFRELARSAPADVVERIRIIQAGRGSPSCADAIESSSEKTWFAVLGISSSATAEEAKAAYKRLIKQNHPDRVHGMSPAFRRLAEVETKRLNAALLQALSTTRKAAAAEQSSHAA